MLESMIENPRPTRAEASDVANAIYDGTDAVMLSAETAAGKYPVEAVKMMAKIVLETEGQDLPRASERGQPGHVRLSVAETICESMAHAAEDLDISAIAVFTETGTTARQLSKYRPKSPIFGLSSVESVIHRMTLLWGVHPILCNKLATAEQMVETAERLLEAGGHVQPRQIGHRRRHPDQVGLDQFSAPARAGRLAFRGYLGARGSGGASPRQTAGQEQTAQPGTHSAGALRPLINPLPGSPRGFRVRVFRAPVWERRAQSVPMSRAYRLRGLWLGRYPRALS